MTQRIEPITGLKYGWDLGESGWNSGTDENWLQVGAMIQPVVINIVNSPATSAEGTVYIVGSSPTGAFAGQGGENWRPFPAVHGASMHRKTAGPFITKRMGYITDTGVAPGRRFQSRRLPSHIWKFRTPERGPLVTRPTQKSR